MKKFKSLIAFSLVLSVLMSCLFSVAAISVDGTVTANEKITSELKEQYALTDGKEIFAQVWFSDVDLDVAEDTALQTIGVTKTELNSYESIDSLTVSASVLAKQNDVIQAYIEAKRAAAKDLYIEHNQKLTDKLLKGTEVVYISRYSPSVIAKLSESSAMAIAEYPEIQMISYLTNEISSEVETSSTAAQSSISINDMNDLTRVNAIHTSSNYGYTGQGVKIGISEMSVPTQSAFPNIKISKIISKDPSTDQSNVNHINNVLDIISSVAPDADYYIAATPSVLNFMSGIEDLIDCGVNVINVSRGISEYGSQYGLIEQWLDHIAYQHDVHLIQAVGNSGPSTDTSLSAGPVSGAMAYNIITVGNLDLKGTLTCYDDDLIHEKSSYYTGKELAYKPDICAPGTDINSRFSNGVIWGTSFSAPQVAGVVALMCEQRPTLKTQQTTVKAILTASVNFDYPHRYTPLDFKYKQYGAGLLDCVGACYVVAGYRYTNSNIASGTTSKTHTFTVTSSDSRIRVSLAFNMKSAGSSTNHEYPDINSDYDLNIQVKDPNGKIVGSSTTTNNNVEIVEFIPTTTGKYSVIVTRVDKSAETVYYGLAWR